MAARVSHRSSFPQFYRQTFVLMQHTFSLLRRIPGEDVAPVEADEEGRWFTHVMHGRSRITIIPRILTMAGRSTSGFHRSVKLRGGERNSPPEPPTAVPMRLRRKGLDCARRTPTRKSRHVVLGAACRHDRRSLRTFLLRVKDQGYIVNAST